MNMVFFISGFIFFLTLLLLSLFPLNNTGLVWFTLFSMVCMIMSDASYILWKLFYSNSTVKYLLAVVYGLTMAVGPTLEEISFVALLAPMVPSSCQSYAESMRQVFVRVGAVVALLTSPSVFPWLIPVSITFMSVLSIAVIVVFIRRKHFINIQAKF